MRIVKEHDERKNEIIQVAEKLIFSKGYSKCTVNDILKETNIAKGTFYHYFQSKEDVMDAIVEGYVNDVFVRAQNVLATTDISMPEKLMHAFLSLRMPDKVDADMIEKIHKTENALLHQKLLKEIALALTPILVEIIEEGIQNESWTCMYPKEYMQIILSATLILTDHGIFEHDPKAEMQIIHAIISILEEALHVPKNSFLSLFLALTPMDAL